MNTGVIKEVTTHIRDYDYELICGSNVDKVYPEEYEIPRENTGTLKNQGNVGACVAEVIAQIAEVFYREEMSEGHIYATFRYDYDGHGLYMSDAMSMWKTIGTLPKKYFDVLKEMPGIKKIVEKFPELKEKAEKFKLKGYAKIKCSSNSGDNAIKDALTKYGYGLVAVSNDYFDGCHCIMLTGWNDKKNKYKIKNSWGETYGDDGFAEIPKDAINEVYVPFFEDIVLPFKDIKEDDWFYKYVKSVYLSGIMTGTSEITFEPNRQMTRAEFATAIDRLCKMIDERFDIFNRVLKEKYILK